MQRLKYYVYDIIQGKSIKNCVKLSVSSSRQPESLVDRDYWVCAVIPVSQTLIITNFGYF